MEHNEKRGNSENMIDRNQQVAPPLMCFLCVCVILRDSFLLETSPFLRKLCPTLFVIELCIFQCNLAYDPIPPSGLEEVVAFDY